MSTLSSNAGIARPSPTLRISARAKALAEAGEDVIALAAGEPDFPTPAPICEAAKRAIDDGKTKYGPSAGVLKLRLAIAEKLAKDNSVTYDPSEIVVSTGAKQCLFNAIFNVAGLGDEVILLAPYWMTYADQVRLAGATPVVVHLRPDHGFQPEIESIRAAITPRTRAIILNSPCNPTGAVFSRQVLEALADLACERNLWLITDEIYEKLIYDGEHVSVGALSNEVKERTILVGGFSKTFAMTGWRLGYLAAPKAVAEAAATLQDQITSNATTFAQEGAITALGLSSECVATMRDAFRSRRDVALAELAAQGLLAVRPSGAFYILFDVQEFIGGRIENDAVLAEKLLEEARVALIPGSVFEASGHLRLSYTASEADIVRGIRRVGEALRTLK